MAPERKNTLQIIALVLLAALGASCSRRHPLIGPPGQLGLRTAAPFETRDLVTQPPVELAKMPIEPATDVIDRARDVSASKPDLPSMSITLAEVRKYALENNLDLRVQMFDPAIAEAGYESERGKFEAVLDTAITEDSSRDSDAQQAKTFSLAPAISVPTQFGGTASISLPFARRDSQQIIPGTFPPLTQGRTDTPGLRFGISQPVLRGAGTDFNYATINISGLLMRQADARTKLAAIRVLSNAEQFYWLHYAAYENLKIQFEQYELAQEQVRTAQRLVEEGARTKIEVTRAESDLARRFERIIIAENTRRRTELALKRMMNAPSLAVQSATLLLPVTPPSPQGLTFDRDRIVGLALENRMELLQNELQLAQDRVTLNLNRNLERPDVRLNFNYSFSGTASNFERALDFLFNRRNDTYSMGFIASIPLGGNQRAKYDTLQSALVLSQTEANREALRMAIREEVLNAINSVELNWQRILSNRAAVARAQQTYQDNRLEFQLGKITSTELLLTLDQLAEARSAEVLSITDYQNSLVDLAFASGTVLGQSGVTWTPRPLR